MLLLLRRYYASRVIFLVYGLIASWLQGPKCEVRAGGGGGGGGAQLFADDPLTLLLRAQLHYRQQQLLHRELDVSQLLFARFHYLFQDASEAAKQQFLWQRRAPQLEAAAGDEKLQAAAPEPSQVFLLNTSHHSTGASNLQLDSRANQLHKVLEEALDRDEASRNKRRYFRILNQVFSLVELPQQYKQNAPAKGQGSTASQMSTGGGGGGGSSRCSQHIGCLDEISNIPILLKKANVSATFTVYTRNSKAGHRIPYEPIMHHQLEDAAETLASQWEMEKRLKQMSAVDQLLQLGRPRLHPSLTGGPLRSSSPLAGAFHQPAAAGAVANRLTASSWRTAAKIVRSQEFPFDLAAMEQCGFNASLTTRVIIGGYFAKEDEEWIDEVVRLWLQLEPSNIIKVSWADSNRGLYHTAAYNSRIVGRQLTLFLHYLGQLFGIDMGRFHLVGHSLGAHIAAMVGADHQGDQVARITGLDPAGPIFVELNSSLRLDPTDAKFVDVLHTNGGSITKGALGLSSPSGHVDYYANGGSTQPGCYFSSVTRSIMDPVERVACNHRRSYRYFTEILRLTIGEAQLAAESKGTDPLQAGPRHWPKAFLFENKNLDELTRLMQPELVLMSPPGGRMDLAESPPLRRDLEFHLLEPNFPPAKSGLYFFKTRPEAPFFGSQQYALTLRTEFPLKRKMTLMFKIEQTLVAEVELDEIPGAYTVTFAPTDPRLAAALAQEEPVQVWFMWRLRSFNLLLGAGSQQSAELALISLELTHLDSDAPLGAPQAASGASRVLEFRPNTSLQEAAPPMSLVNLHPAAAAPQSQPAQNLSAPEAAVRKAPGLALARNQWYRFETGRRRVCADCQLQKQ